MQTCSTTLSTAYRRRGSMCQIQSKLLPLLSVMHGEKKCKEILEVSYTTRRAAYTSLGGVPAASDTVGTSATRQERLGIRTCKQE
jgi:hypothetical protein